MQQQWRQQLNCDVVQCVPVTTQKATANHAKTLLLACLVGHNCMHLTFCHNHTEHMELAAAAGAAATGHQHLAAAVVSSVINLIQV
jgi:hypothetical protein